MLKVTKKAVLEFANANNKKVRCCGYCELDKYVNRNDPKLIKLGYAAGVYGWNYDVFLYNDLIIVTGYRPFNYTRLSAEDFQ